MLDDAAEAADAEGVRTDPPAEFLSDALEGLSRPQKSIPPKYFYDAAGSALFEEICRTPEYYPTRTETALLATVAAELGPVIPDGAALVEFGSGASEKTRLLLDAAPQIRLYVPLDISAAALAPAAERIREAYPQLEVRPVQADFTRPARRPELAGAPAVIGFFPGSTIGNFEADEADRFLQNAHDLLGPQSQFLIGADLVKDIGVLVRAYDDAQGVTAAFNLNLLRRMNRELGTDFVLENFAHRALWNPTLSRIEMHLESLSDQNVHLAGRTFSFARGETLHTENSHKFTPDSMAALAAGAGWTVARQWTDDLQFFGEFLLVAS